METTVVLYSWSPEICVKIQHKSGSCCRGHIPKHTSNGFPRNPGHAFIFQMQAACWRVTFPVRMKGDASEKSLTLGSLSYLLSLRINIFFHFALTRSEDKNVRLLLFQQSQEHRCKALTARDLREVSFGPCFSAWKYGIF